MGGAATGTRAGEVTAVEGYGLDHAAWWVFTRVP